MHHPACVLTLKGKTGMCVPIAYAVLARIVQLARASNNAPANADRALPISCSLCNDGFYLVDRAAQSALNAIRHLEYHATRRPARWMTAFWHSPFKVGRVAPEHHCGNDAAVARSLLHSLVRESTRQRSRSLRGGQATSRRRTAKALAAITVSGQQLCALLARDDLRTLSSWLHNLVSALGARGGGDGNDDAVEVGAAAKQERSVLNAWTCADTACANSLVVYYNALISGLMRCSSANYHIGCSEDAKCTYMYMCKYNVKESCALANAVSVLVNARRHVEAYLWTATYTDTVSRGRDPPPPAAAQ
jgi:hypothetical protein